MTATTSFRPRFFAGTLPGLLAFALLAAGPVAPAQTYSAGHGDLGIGYAPGDGVLDLHVHLHAGSVVDGSPLMADTEFEAGDVVIRVPVSTYNHIVGTGGRNADPAYAPIGVSAGQGYWFLPQSDSGPGGSDALGSPFLGLGAEELDPLDWAGNLTLSLVSVTGPGYFSMWVGGFSPTFHMSTFDGISGADQFVLAPGGHEHVNFSFSQAGTYQVTWSGSGTHNIDGAVSGTATYTFEVLSGTAQVPEPSTFGMVGGAAFMLWYATRHKTRKRPGLHAR